MVKIKPFKGLRPPQALVEFVESRPYDVLSSEEARKEAGTNEKSLYHITRPEINFPVGTDEHDPRSMEVLPNNLQNSSRKAGLCRTKRSNITSMHSL